MEYAKNILSIENKTIEEQFSLFLRYLEIMKKKIEDKEQDK